MADQHANPSRERPPRHGEKEQGSEDEARVHDYLRLAGEVKWKPPSYSDE